jgi:hypothetical protein
MAVDTGASDTSLAVTPSDSATQPLSRALFVGGAGNITGRLTSDTTDTVFNGIAAGTILPLRFKLIKATGTTATGLVALF